MSEQLSPTPKGEVSVAKDERNTAIWIAYSRPDATVTAVAREFGISRKRVRQVVDRYRDRISELREVREDELALKFDNFAEEAIEELLERDLEKVPPVQLMTAAAIAVDKARLLRGKATQVVAMEVRHKVDELAPALLAELKRRGKTVPEIDLVPNSVTVEEMKG